MGGCCLKILMGQSLMKGGGLAWDGKKLGPWNIKIGDSLPCHGD